MQEKVPEVHATEGSQEKKKKKKKVDIEDMYSFDLTMMEPPKPSKPEKKKKSNAESDQPSLKDLERAMKFMTKIIEKEEPAKIDLEDLQEAAQSSLEPMHIPEPKIKAQEKEEDVALLRFPSPSRSRQGSPNKQRDASPKKQEEKKSTNLKASAVEFVPPGSSPPSKVTSSLHADASEFVPPGFAYAQHVGCDTGDGVQKKLMSTSPAKESLKASAAEFVPPGFEPQVVKSTCKVEQTKSTLIAPVSETPSQPLWAHAVFTPSTALESSKQQKPTETQPIIPPIALNKCETSLESDIGTSEDSTALVSARVNPSSILSKVKMSLTAQFTRLAPSSYSKEDAPEIGKVHDKVRKIEEQEADNEAEKQREEAIKLARQEKDNKKQMEMDETMMDCFLQAVTTHVKERDLPMMGTTLYGKHMRSSRRIGTSCDVKDSSYVWLRPFLESLEDENLIKLKPEIKDPTVVWVNRNHELIRNWKPWKYNEIVGYKKNVPRR